LDYTLALRQRQQQRGRGKSTDLGRAAH